MIGWAIVAGLVAAFSIGKVIACLAAPGTNRPRTTFRTISGKLEEIEG